MDNGTPENITPSGCGYSHCGGIEFENGNDIIRMSKNLEDDAPELNRE